VGGDVSDGVKLQNKASYAVTTTARGGTAIPQNIALNAVKPATANLLNVNTVTPPPGVTAILTNGAAYKMQFAGVEIGNVTFEQGVAGQYDPTYLSYADIEVVQSSTVGFTR